MKNEPKQKGDFLTVTDPARFQMAKQMSPLPGSPTGGVEGNPNNVMSFMAEAPNTYQFPYADMGLVGDPRTSVVMPVPPSGMPQMVTVGRGFNREAAMTQQPPAQMGDMMLGNHMGMDAANRGLVPSQMGMIGQGIPPGGVNPQSNEQAPNTMPLFTPPPEELAQQNAMGSKMGRGSRTSKGMRT